MTYPNNAGYTNESTSKEAAKQIEPVRQSLLSQSLKAIQDTECGLTADQVARVLNKSVLSIRPRVSELFKQGLIYDSGIRQLIGRKRHIVWRKIWKE